MTHGAVDFTSFCLAIGVAGSIHSVLVCQGGELETKVAIMAHHCLHLDWIHLYANAAEQVSDLLTRAL